jgi:Uma2 family endonuclease
MSWEEFLDWAPDEGQAEWVDGKGIAHVSNSPRHILMVFFFARLLKRYCEIFDFGEVYVDKLLTRLPARPAGRMPDIVVVGRGDAPGADDRWFEGRARIVAEFLSEDSVERDTIEKADEFAARGFPEYLWADARPNRRDFRFLRLTDQGAYDPAAPDDQGRYHSEALPGFWFRPEWFWQDPLPDPEDLMLEIAPDAYEAWLAAKLRARRERRGEW